MLRAGRGGRMCQVSLKVGRLCVYIHGHGHNTGVVMFRGITLDGLY